jgi:hypothetical protein
MIYVKATAVGIVSGLLLAIVWVLAAGWLPIFFWMFLTRNDSGGGGAGTVVGSGSALLAALIGFVTGFYWTVRRARRRLSI